MGIGVSMLVLTILVLPKIKRVLSGEKVVISNVLAGKYGRRNSSSALESQSTFQQFQDRIVVKKDDPLPRSIETQVYEIQSLLSEIDNLCQEGRTVSLELWQQMQRDVARFKMELDKVDLQWDNEAEYGKAEGVKAEDGKAKDGKAEDDKAEDDEAPAAEF